MQVDVIVTGLNPLLMHNERLANQFDPLVKELKALSGQRKKTDEVLLAMARIEFEGGLYFSEKDGPVLPIYNVKRSIVEGARLDKLGRHVERAFVPLGPDEARLEYVGPRTVAGLFGEGFADFRSVKVGTSKITRCRPRFPEWSLAFPAELDTDVLNMDDFLRCATRAGQMIGLGDFRQRFGRYVVEVS
jgi:hypothetical protein